VKRPLAASERATLLSMASRVRGEVPLPLEAADPLEREGLIERLSFFGSTWRLTGRGKMVVGQIRAEGTA
jgi:hypothetical protein